MSDAERKRLVFVTGGARSGKSLLAERYAAWLAESSGGSVLYVATAEAHDGEMRRRVEEHHRRRPEAWRTLEACRGVGRELRDTGPEKGVVLLDCLSLLVSNALLDVEMDSGDGPELEPEASRVVEGEVSDLISWWESGASELVVVSNEVGWGVVPPSRLGRVYRDVLGRANQRVAERATDAFLVAAGLHVPLKRDGEGVWPVPW